MLPMLIIAINGYWIILGGVGMKRFNGGLRIKVVD
jgi:hypothetical protein